MITVNGVEKTLEKPLSVTEYLETNKYVPVQVAIELNDKILARELYGTTILKEGDIMEIVSFMGGGSGKNEDKLVLGGHEFTSRFILGSGKFSLDLVKACIEKAEAQIITLALRRANEGGLANILDYIPDNVTLLPNTSGARNAEEAVRIARLFQSTFPRGERQQILTIFRLYFCIGITNLHFTSLLLSEFFILFISFVRFFKFFMVRVSLGFSVCF